MMLRSNTYDAGFCLDLEELGLTDSRKDAPTVKAVDHMSPTGLELTGPSAEALGSQAIPSGTVTFLFSDIEGSTTRWEAYPDRMKAAVAGHEAVMRLAVAKHGGYVFKTVGDAFCVAFHIAPQAVAAAADAQRALAKEDYSDVGGLDVRIGLHTGHADERDGDYFGPAVNRVARLMSVGHGGQILVSDATHALVLQDLPANTSLHDLGLHRLKDLSQPEHIWQLMGPELRAEFPAIKTLDLLPNNLPIQITSFRGRESDIEAVKEALDEHHLVTLSGFGGIGKTRLALQAGADLLERFPDGVWFVDLAAITYPEIVASAVSKALGISQSPNRPLEESIVHWLRRKQLLLIVDNCEQVLDDVARLADAILTQCVDVRLLATSRQALNVAGEEVIRLAPLALPDVHDTLRAADALMSPAIALFADRASQANKSFRLGDDNALTVAEICAHLDGLPLAIELAAARVKVLSVDALLQRLDKRFGLLTGGSRTAMPRQRTLTALIDWSHELLNVTEQIFFARASIFAGSFSLTAAEAVCSDEGINEDEVLDLVASLADKSLLIAETTRDAERYRMLESIRAYGSEKLSSAGDYDRLARVHAEYFVRSAAVADESYGSVPDAKWLDKVEPDLDNFRAALEWGFRPENDALIAGAIAGHLERLWREGGLEAEGRKWIGTAQSHLEGVENQRVPARLWRALAWLSSGQAGYDAAQRACELYTKLNDGRGLAHSLRVLAWLLFSMGREDEAAAAIDRALAWFKEYGDKRNVANCLSVQGFMAELHGDVEAAREFYEKALAIFKALGAQSSVAIVLASQGESEFRQGNYVQALSFVDEALQLASWNKNASNLAIYYANRAVYQIALGNLEAARGAAFDALHWARAARNAVASADAIAHLALVSALRGEMQRAAQLRAYVDARYRDLGVSREFTEQWSYDKLGKLLEISARPGAAPVAEGSGWSDDQAIAEAQKV